ncbi:peptidoglycan-binding domain-containing protein [Paenarthrobacter sp. 4246]|uniref:peptidoglycan-binding domain-containing protein n=1 Tax=Paenarthrobacter sp. 4246 TaxID=3156456 RepID=UPI003396CDC0
MEAVHGEVGSTIDITTLASWIATPVAVNRASGVVTEVFVQSNAGALLGQGSPLYSVDLRPVVVAIGAIPSFRNLGPGDRGADVSQLQQMLVDKEIYEGPVTGFFDAVFTDAVKRWQGSMGHDPTGFVLSEDVVFVPGLPARISLDSAVIARGSNVTGGEKAVSSLADQPTFTIKASPAQASMLKPGANIEITSPNDGGVWRALVSASGIQQDGQGTNFELTGHEGAVICGTDCSSVPLGGLELPSKLVVVESTTGLTLPTAAVLSQPNGELEVIDRQGGHHKVRIAVSALGMSIVDGVDPGTWVRVPAKSSQGES